MSLRVLIVDDNRDGADTLAALLDSEGFEVRVAYDGQLALALAQQFHPDVFIIDLVMPNMDGFQLARRLRATPEFARALLIALTGLSAQRNLDEASKAQFDEYVHKPPKMSTLLAILSEASGPIHG
jgi:CheY-like chemotaxis protein